MAPKAANRNPLVARVRRTTTSALNQQVGHLARVRTVRNLQLMMNLIKIEIENEAVKRRNVVRAATRMMTQCLLYPQPVLKKIRIRTGIRTRRKTRAGCSQVSFHGPSLT